MKSREIDREAERLIKRITFYLQEHPKAKTFSTQWFDDVALQWLEYGRITTAQMQILHDIVQRHIPKDLKVPEDFDYKQMGNKPHKPRSK